MRALVPILRLLGELVLPVVIFVGIYLIVEGVSNKRDGMVIGGAIMLGSLAIAGRIFPGRNNM